jgi:hypothetical protein
MARTYSSPRWTASTSRARRQEDEEDEDDCADQHESLFALPPVL